VRNLRRSQVRADRRRERREELAARPEALPSPAELVERAELQRLLVESVLALDEAERTAVLLRYFEGQRRGRRAHRVPANVRSRLSRGLERLRERLEGRIDRHDLLAGLCVLAREPGFAPTGAGPATHALPWIGGLLAMKTLITIAAGCAAVAEGLWFLGRDSSPRPGPVDDDRKVLTAVLERVDERASETPAQPEPAARVALDVQPAETPAPAPAEEAPLPVRILARLIDEQGAGIADVEVQRYEEPVGRSGAQGRVELDIPFDARSDLTVRVPPRRLRAARRSVWLSPGAEVHLGDVALQPAATVRGWVVDESGAKCPRARSSSPPASVTAHHPEELRRLGHTRGRLPRPRPIRGGFEPPTCRSGAQALGGQRPRLGPAEVEVARCARRRARVRARSTPPTASGRVPRPTASRWGQIHTWFMAASFGTGASSTPTRRHPEILLQQRVAHDLTAVSDPENRWSEVYLPGGRARRCGEDPFEKPRWIDVRGRPDGKPIAGLLGLEELSRAIPRMTPHGSAEDGRTRLRVPTARFRVLADAYARAPDSAPSTRRERAGLAPTSRRRRARGVVLTSSGSPARRRGRPLPHGGDHVTVEKNGFRLRRGPERRPDDRRRRGALRALSEGESPRGLSKAISRRAPRLRSARATPPQRFDPHVAPAQLRLAGAAPSRAAPRPRRASIRPASCSPSTAATATSRRCASVPTAATGWPA
jgi:hypothetical protein